MTDQNQSNENQTHLNEIKDSTIIVPFTALVERMNHLAASLPLGNPVIHSNLWVRLTQTAQTDEKAGTTTFFLMAIPEFNTHAKEEVEAILAEYNKANRIVDEATSDEDGPGGDGPGDE